MDRLRFEFLTQNPLEVNQEDLPGLLRIIRTFPYFEKARILFLVGQFKRQDIRFREDLKKHIPHISQRGMLQALIQRLEKGEFSEIAQTPQEEAPLTVKPESEELKFAETPAPTEDLKNETHPNEIETSELISTENEPQLEESLDASSEEQDSPSSPFISEPEPVEDVFESEAPELELPDASIQTPLESESVESAPIGNEAAEPELPTDPSLAEADKYIEQLIISSAINHSIQAEVDLKEVEEEEERETETTPFQHVAQSDEFKEDASDFGAWLASMQNAKSTPAKKPYSDLIDRFIQTDPTTIRVKKDFFSPVDMGKKSTEDNEEIVTETLANIYAQQGDYAKAKRAFEKLALKNPEKKTYFAARIEELHKVKNEKKK